MTRKRFSACWGNSPIPIERCLRHRAAHPFRMLQRQFLPKKKSPVQHEHYTHTAPDIPSSTALSIFFFLLHFLLMQLLFFLLVPFQDFLHSLLCSRPILHTGQFDQQITHDHSIMGTANDKSYDTTHDNLEDDTHQDIHQVSHQDSTPSAVILHLIPHFQLVQKRILRKRVKHIILDRTA